MKYEEQVEIGERWSKPHVSTTSLRGIHMFRDALISKQCVVGLDETLSGSDYQVAGNIAVTRVSLVAPKHFASANLHRVE